MSYRDITLSLLGIYMLFFLFCYIEKPRRGYYNMVLSMGEENPKLLSPGALTVKFVRYLENIIRLQPPMWLWSHRRWKYEWKDEYDKLWVDVEKPGSYSRRQGNYQSND